MEQKWDHGSRTAVALKKLAEELSTWDKETFGNIFRRKKRIQLRPKGTQRALARGTTTGLLKLEAKLRKK